MECMTRACMQDPMFAQLLGAPSGLDEEEDDDEDDDDDDEDEDDEDIAAAVKGRKSRVEITELKVLASSPLPCHACCCACMHVLSTTRHVIQTEILPQSVVMCSRNLPRRTVLVVPRGLTKHSR